MEDDCKINDEVTTIIEIKGYDEHNKLYSMLRELKEFRDEAGMTDEESWHDFRENLIERMQYGMDTCLGTKYDLTKTINNLGNFHFEEIEFDVSPWDERTMYSRLIASHEKLPDTYFLLQVKNQDELTLYIYFRSLSTAQNQKIFEICNIPADYISALRYLNNAEMAIINFINSWTRVEIKNIMSQTEFRSIYSAFYKEVKNEKYV